MTDIAVVVPFLGSSFWSSLLPSLEALNSQTVRANITIVLSVDGFDTVPPEILELIDVCVCGDQKGPASARNRGWRAASCPFILFTDSDCIPESTWAEKMTDKLKAEYQAVKGVYSSGGIKLIQRLSQVEFEERYRLMRKARTLYLADTYSAGFRREWLEKLDGFDESFPLPEHEDVDLSWRLTSAGGKIGFVPDARVAHIHRESWRAYFRMKYRRGKWRIMLVRKFPSRAIQDGYTPQTLKFQMLLSIPLLLSVVLLPFFPIATLILSLLFLLLSAPLMLTAGATDPSTLFFVPFFALWRGVALFAGACRGILSGGVRCLHR